MTYAALQLRQFLRQQHCRRAQLLSTTTKSRSRIRSCQPSSVRHQQRIYSSCCSATLSTSTKTTNLVANSSRTKSTMMMMTNETTTTTPRCCPLESSRLERIRNVGIFAHVDAGKTTVTERMLALSGVVRSAGCVDDGNTVTDYLPAERERGITIQSAAISFPWTIHNNNDDDRSSNEVSTISLIDTPGHVDFSVEVNRSLSVLDSAVVVIDSVAGVQAQTETVWRAINNNRLPCIFVINKMDKVGCNFNTAIQSIKQKLNSTTSDTETTETDTGVVNPIPIQIPLFRTKKSSSTDLLEHVIAIPTTDTDTEFVGDDFVGVIDLLRMRIIVWPESNKNTVHNVETCIPTIIPLTNCCSQQLTQVAYDSREELIEAIAECDEYMEELYVLSDNSPAPTCEELCAALRRITISRKGMPVVAAAAVRGMGVEPILDCIVDYLPSPLHRVPPKLLSNNLPTTTPEQSYPIGHPLSDQLLALAFKVVHMKGRGGSGDGRVVFARVYSGTLNDRDSVTIASSASGAAVRKERIGGMLELAGGTFQNLDGGMCTSGDVCALIGLKSVVTGDTIIAANTTTKATNTTTVSSSDTKRRRKSCSSTQQSHHHHHICLAGVTAPNPVLTVRLEAESTDQQSKLLNALTLLAIEDPSLVVQDTGSVLLLSGLGELHIEVILDRIRREYGLVVSVGAPSVTYRETVTEAIGTDGLLAYNRPIGNTERLLQASVSLRLEPIESTTTTETSATELTEPIVRVSDSVKELLSLDFDDDDDHIRCDVYKSLVQGCLGAMKRGPHGNYPLANVRCVVQQIDGSADESSVLPGAIRAATANAIHSVLSDHKDFCQVVEPKMSLEVSGASNAVVGSVLSDLTGNRRGIVQDVRTSAQDKATIRATVPLIEIVGYASSLRSLTGGEGTFSAEYQRHGPI